MTEQTTAREACDLGWSITMIGRGYAAVVDPVFADFPRGARGYQLLHTVIHNDIRTQIALADYLGVDRTVMPYLVDDLQLAGYVERQNDPTDRRVRTVIATPEGMAKYEELSHRVLTAEQEFFAGVPLEKRGPFLDVLADLAHTSRNISRPAAR